MPITEKEFEIKISRKWLFKQDINIINTKLGYLD